MIKRMTSKEINKIKKLGFSYCKIYNRMKNKYMTFEEAIAYKSSCDVYDEYRKKAKKLGISMEVIRHRYKKGLRGGDLFKPVKRGGVRGYKLYYKGKPLVDTFKKNCYCKIMQYRTRHKLTIEQAIKEMQKRGLLNADL
jgi:hypothetical protein